MRNKESFDGSSDVALPPVKKLSVVVETLAFEWLLKVASNQVFHYHKAEGNRLEVLTMKNLVSFASHSYNETPFWCVFF